MDFTGLTLALNVTELDCVYIDVFDAYCATCLYMECVVLFDHSFTSFTSIFSCCLSHSTEYTLCPCSSNAFPMARVPAYSSKTFNFISSPPMYFVLARHLPATQSSL